MKFSSCLILIVVAFGLGFFVLFGLAIGLSGLGSSQGESPAGELATGGNDALGRDGSPTTTSGDLATSVEGFNPNLIIEDRDFTNTSTMTAESIQQFLAAEKSVLTNYAENGKSAATIIYEASQRYGINPQVIIVVLQKEQSLIGPIGNVTHRLNRAMGAGCPDGADCDKFRAGFTRQIEYGTSLLRRWFDRAEEGSRGARKVGQSYVIDGKSVRMGNRATSSLYMYTPHIVPDKTNFYRYFRKYFLNGG